MFQHYDHLLGASEVPEHSIRVAGQLCALGVKDLIFFARSISEDKNLKSYLDCISIASQMAGIELKFIDLPTKDV